MRRIRSAWMALCLVALALVSIGCSSQDIAQAHKGRMFNKTGALAFWAGGNGFDGPILGPGTYYTGIYNELRKVNCSETTKKEGLTALTKDGVQYELDIYVRYSANCSSDQSIQNLLATLAPAAPAAPADPKAPAPKEPQSDGSTITVDQIYDTYIRPALGEAVRESISPVIANEVNERRDAIFVQIRKKFEDAMAKKQPPTVLIQAVNLSNMDYPAPMKAASTERATQAVLRDKAIAERERVSAETETSAMRLQLAQNEGKNEAAKIDAIGAALRRNPDFLQYDIQQKMPDIYAEAGKLGNMIIAAPSPQVILQRGAPAAHK